MQEQIQVTGKDIPIEQGIFNYSWKVLKQYHNADLSDFSVASKFQEDINNIERNAEENGGSE